METILASDTTVTANSKHSLTLSQMSIKPYITGLPTSVTFTQYIMSSFQPKITRHIKRLKIQSAEINQASEPDSEMKEEILQLIPQKHKGS